MERVLTVREVAELEQVSTAVISGKCKAGAFPGAYKTSRGGAWRIPVSALDAYRGRVFEDLERGRQPQPTTEGIAPLSPRSRLRRSLVRSAA